MRKLSCHLRNMATALLTLLLVHLGTAFASAQVLWIADDVTKTIYQVTLDGKLVSSFPQVEGAVSSLALDADTGSLWGTNESPPKVVNFTKTGELISFMPAALFGGYSPEGVSVAADGSLWILDEPELGPGPPTVLHITRDGLVIDSFATTDFDVAATSPQGIAVDPFDSSLWITDNFSDMIYNVSPQGELLDALPSSLFGGLTNLQGISVDSSNGSLWTTARDTSTIYNITRAGELISSFPSAAFDLNSFDPTGIAFECPDAPSTPPGLRTAVEDLVHELAAMGRVNRHFVAAAKELRKALGDYWESENELNKHGGKVFGSLRKAVKALKKVKRNRAAKAAIQELAKIAAELAAVAIEQAAATGNDKHDFEKALRAFERGRRELAQHKPEKAIIMFGVAWKLAFQSMHS